MLVSIVSRRTPWYSCRAGQRDVTINVSHDKREQDPASRSGIAIFQRPRRPRATFYRWNSTKQPLHFPPFFMYYAVRIVPANGKLIPTFSRRSIWDETFRRPRLTQTLISRSRLACEQYLQPQNSPVIIIFFLFCLFFFFLVYYIVARPIMRHDYAAKSEN